MSDIVRETAPPFGSQFDLNRGVNTQSRNPISLAGFTVSTSTGNPSSLLTGAFADVFASLAPPTRQQPGQPDNSRRDDSETSSRQSQSIPRRRPPTRQRAQPIDTPLVSTEIVGNVDQRPRPGSNALGNQPADHPGTDDDRRDADPNDQIVVSAVVPVETNRQDPSQASGDLAGATGPAIDSQSEALASDQQDQNAAVYPSTAAVASIAGSPNAENSGAIGGTDSVLRPEEIAAQAGAQAAAEATQSAATTSDPAAPGPEANQEQASQQPFSGSGSQSASQQASDQNSADNQSESGNPQQYPGDPQSQQQAVADGPGDGSGLPGKAADASSAEYQRSNLPPNASPESASQTPAAAINTLSAAASAASAVSSQQPGGASRPAASGSQAAGINSTADASASASTGPNTGAASLAEPGRGDRPDTAAGSTSGAGSTDAASGTDVLTRIKLVQRVSRAFQHIGSDGGLVRLRLAPAELGTVRVEIQIQDKKVDARVVAETEAATAALRENLPELRTRLESYGLDVDRLDVETQSGGETSLAGKHSSGQDDDPNQPQPPRRYQSQDSGPPPTPPGVPASALVSASTVTGGVDLHL